MPTRAPDTGDRPPRGAIQAFTPGADLAPPLAVTGVRFVRYSEPFLARLAAAMELPEVEIHRRRAMGSRASLALLQDDSVAGYGWVNYDAWRIYELGIEIAIPRGHAYIWDCATLPEYRGRRIFPGLLRFMAEDLRRQGIIQIWAGVAPGNEASLHAFRRAGFRLVAYSSLSPGIMEATPTAEATAEEVAFLRTLHVMHLDDRAL